MQRAGLEQLSQATQETESSNPKISLGAEDTWIKYTEEATGHTGQIPGLDGQDLTHSLGQPWGGYMRRKVPPAERDSYQLVKGQTDLTIHTVGKRWTSGVTG